MLTECGAPFGTLAASSSAHSKDAVITDQEMIDVVDAEVKKDPAGQDSQFQNARGQWNVLDVNGHRLFGDDGQGRLLWELVRGFFDGDRRSLTPAVSKAIKGKLIAKVSTALAVEDQARLAAIAKIEGVSVREILRRLIRDALDDARR